MKLKRILLNNIRTYENQEIIFPNGSILLSGDIGSGKSTVLLALEFALFGLQTGYLSGASLLRNGKDSGSVEIELEIEGKTIKIKRGLKKSKKSITQEKGIFSMNNHEEELGAEELKQRVLDLFGYPPSLIKAKTNLLYRFTVYTPQEEMKQILQENADERVDVLRKIFGIDKYKKIAANIDLVAARVREESRAKESLILDLPSLKNQKEERIRELNEETAKIQEILPEFNSVKKEVGDAEKEYEKILLQIIKANELKPRLASIISELNLRENEFVEVTQELKENETQLREIEAKIKANASLLETLENFSEKIKQKLREQKLLLENSREIGSRIGALEFKKSEIVRTIQEIDSMNECPTCKQKVTTEHKHKIAEENSKKLEEISHSLQSLSEESEEISKKLKELEKELETLREKDKEYEKAKMIMISFNEKTKHIEKLNKKREETMKRIVLLKQQKEKIEKELTEFKDIDTLAIKIKQRIDSLRKKEREIEIEKVKHERNVENSKRIISMLEQEIIRKEQISQDIVKLKNLNEWLTKHYMEIITKIERAVMTKLNREFNLLFKKWFGILVDNLDARIDENFTPVIEQMGYEISYPALSGGERTAAALAYRLALNQIINHFMGKLKTKGLLILDEPTDGFSSEQLEKMKDILNELEFEQLILVSHESEIEDFVENVINFEKNGGVTRVY